MNIIINELFSIRDELDEPNLQLQQAIKLTEQLKLNHKRILS